jgi:transposase
VRSENLIRPRANAQAQRYGRHRQPSGAQSPGVREAIDARGATLRYLPQYSPDLNPIEMPFSKLKACNYFRHAGYA